MIFKGKKARNEPPVNDSSSFNGPIYDPNLESLEVHEMGASTSHHQEPRAPDFRSVPFSRRKALIVSSVLTGVVLLFTGVSSVFLTRSDNNRGENPVELTSDLTLRSDEKFGVPSELIGEKESLIVKGDIITQGVIKISDQANVMVIQATNLTGSRTFSLPDNDGTFCTDANNCNYAGIAQLGQLSAQVAQLGQQLGQVNLTSGVVTSLNNQQGVVTLQGSANRISVNTANGIVTVSTPQDLDANANVQFGSLRVSPTGTIFANNLSQTAVGNDVSISAGADSIMFTAGGRTFQLPASGPGTQTICTDGAVCATGLGEAVLLSDGAAQSDTDADASIFINDTGGGHLIRLQSLGVDRLAVANNGDTTVSGSLTVSSLGNGFVRSTGGALSVVSAIDLSSSDVTNTLPVNRGGTGSTSLDANGVLVGNGTSPVSSVAAGGSGLCLVSTAGAPTFTTCPGVSSLNGQAGSLTLQGTTNQVSVNTAAGVITLSTPQDINTTSSPTFAALTLTGLSNGVVKASGGTLTTGLVSLTTEVNGTLPVANGGTGSAATPTNGQLLIGNGTNYTLATLSQGAGIAIANGSGTITISSIFGNSIDLGSETTGDYVATISGNGGVNITGGSGAGSTPSVALVLQANKGLEVDVNGLSLIDCGLNQILKYNGSNQWACAADETGSFTVAGDSGTPQTVTNGDTVSIAGGNNITTSAGATDTVTINTVNNPTFTTSVTTPLLQSSGALTITPNGALAVGSTTQTALLQGSSTTITSNGVGNDIVLTSANQIRFTGFDCTAFANGGTLTTDASGNISCADDNASPANTLTGAGTANRIALFTGSQELADSWILQNGSTLELDNTRNLSITGGNFSVVGTGLFSGLITANGGLTLEAGDTLTFNGDAFTDLTGTGLLISSGSLQTTLGTSVDLTSEVDGILPVTNGGTGMNGSAAANGTLLIGNGTGYTLANLTAGSGITVNNSAGGIEIVNFFGTSIESGEITDLTITGADIANDTIALGTKTTGNYVASVTGNAQISVGGSGSETAAVTLSLVADSIGDAQLEFNTGQNLTATSSPTFNGLTLSGTLAVQGGNVSVGTATQAGTLTLSDGSNNTGLLQTGSLGQDTTFNLIDPGLASVDICLSTGNCANAGGGVTTAGGTANRIALFNGAQTIADSWLLQNGSTLQLDNTRNLELLGGNLTLTNGNLSVTGNQTTSGTVTFSSLANGFLEVNGSGVVAVGTIDLGADTTGNYVATITAGNGISGSSATEAGTPTIALSNLTADWVQSGAFDIVLNDAGSEIRMLESVGGTYYGLFDVGDLSADETYSFLQGGTVVTSGNVSTFATTGVTAGSGLIGGGTTGALTVNIGAGNGIQVNADDIAVVYGSTANTAVEGDTQITITAGTNLTGGGNITLGAGGTLTVNVADSPSFAGNVTVQGGTITAGSATQSGSVVLNDGSANTGTLQTTPLSANQTYTLPDDSGTICLSTGNCAGAGGGVTTAGGNANRLAMFTGAQTVADSWLLQNGSTLQLDNTRNLELIGGNLTLTNGNLSVTGNQTTSGTVTFSALANGFLEVNGSGLVSVGTIDLGADTTGNFVATITAGNGITGSSNSEGGTPTIALGPLSADWVQSGAFDVVFDNAGAELRILESVGGTFYGTFDVGDLSQNEAYTFLQGGTVVTSGNVSSFATTAVAAGNGLTGGGTNGALTLDIGAGNGITVNANDIAVIYGSAANTAVQGNTSITVTAGTNLGGGGSITLGAGGTVTLNVDDSPTFAGTVTVQGTSVSIGTASTTTGQLDLFNATSAFAGSVQVSSLGQATLYTLPDPGQATATICLSTGNCAGAGGGVTTAGGTANQLAKFNGAQSIADSTITDDGTNVTTTVDLVIQGGAVSIGTLAQSGALTLFDGTSNSATIVLAAHAGNYTYTIPDAGANDEFCIRALGNCSGAAGGNAPNSAQYLTLALDGGLTAERTLSFNGTNFSVTDGGANGAYSVNTAQDIATTSAPSFAGLTLTGNLNMGTNTIQGSTAVINFDNFDVAANGNVTAGTFNGQTISSTASFTGTVAVAGLTTLNGGLTVETGDTFTFNGDSFTDLTGNGLQVTTGVLSLAVQANKGLEVDVNGLSLIDCASGEILKYNGSNQWVCAPDAGASGTGDDVLVNGVNADGANFVNTTSSAAIAGVSINLNAVASPDEISINISDASGTLAGIVTANDQTFGGIKTFNGQIVAGAGINLGAQTITGTTGVIDFNNFDVSGTGAVTAVGVNAGSGLLQGTGGLTVAGTTTFSSLTNGFLEVNGSGVVSVGTIDLGTDTSGNYVATITSGNGISAAATGEGSTPTIALSNLTADWLQSGAFDVVLDNAGSELKIREAAGAFYAIFDVADLTADQTFLFETGGTVVTSGNVANYATTAVTAGNGLTGGGTVGPLTLNIASANGGIVVNANDIALTLQANKGLEVDANGLSLIDCASGEILKYNGSNQWVCAPDAGAAGLGDSISVNGTNVDDANFINTTASASVAGVSIGLNAVATPDEISIQISDASGTLAGIVTANNQTFGGDKTFNGLVTAGAGISLGAQTLQGTTAVINFNNFDVTSTGDVTAAGSVTAVGVNAGSGLLQGTGGLTVAGTVTFSSLTSGFLEVNGSGVVSVGTIDLGTDTSGNYVATITAGNGISGSSNTEGGTPTIALGNLTSDWLQSGAFDLVLDNASSELKIRESAGAFYAILDVSDLTGDQTFTLSEGGIVITSGNVASYATTAVTAGTGLTGGGTVGALTLNVASANGGIVVNANDIALTIQANKGLEVDANGLSLIDCASGEILKYNGSNQWACAPDAGAAGTGDDVLVNGVGADGANFINTTASASVAGVSIALNAVATPDEISLQISDASGTLAGIVTANAQTFGGSKTFNGQIVAGAGINMGTTTLSGTTAVIDFNNFDVSSAGAVTAVGVNAGTGLLQGTGGITVAGTATFSSLTNGFLEVNGSGVVSVGTIDLGTDTSGNYVATITAGNGISGSATGEGSTPTIALSNLTADWLQSGAFDLVLDNAASELKIRESAGAFYAIFDVADLTADQTFLFETGGTVVTSGNVASYATTAVTAGTGLTGGGTVGALTLNVASANGGIVVNANDIALTLQANKGLEVDANGLSLIDCGTDGYVLKYNLAGGTWGCAADAGAAGTGDDVSVNGTNADGANFANTAASATAAATTWSLNTGTTPDTISLALGIASATEAGIVTANAQSFGGVKTFEGQIIANAGINLNAQTLQGTTAVIDFTNFDVDASGNLNTAGTIGIGGTTRINTSGTFFGAAGSAATPSYNFAGETGNNTGMFLGANDQLGFATGGTQRLLLDASGNAIFSGSGDFAVSLTVGTNDAFQITSTGNMVFEGATADAFEFTVTVADPTADRTYTIPNSTNATDTFCLVTLGNCAGSGGGVTTAGGTTNRIAKFSGAQAIADSSISDNGTVVTVLGSTDLTVEGGEVTVGTTSLQGGLVLHDGNGQTTTLRAGNSVGNLNYTLPDADGSNGQCLKTNGTGGWSFSNCNNGSGAGGSITLQNAYDAGNTITTTDNRHVGFTLADTANDANFLVNIATGSTGKFAIQDNATDEFRVDSSGAYALTLTLGNALGISYGGTGATTSQGAINNISQLTTNGDLLYHNGTNSTRLGRGTNGQCLTSNASTIVWGSCGAGGDGGVTTVGTFSTTNTAANGATISGTEIIFQSASASAPGMVDTGAQTFAGAKTFNSSVTVATNLTVDTNTLFVDATTNNIGIGTATPEFKLQVVSEGGAGAGFISNDMYGGGAIFQGRSANGTLASPTALTTGNIIAQFSGRGYGATGFSSTRAAIVMNAAENWTDVAQGSEINFFTTPIGGTTLTQQAVLTGTGNFALGGATPVAPFGGRVLNVQNTTGNSSLYLSSGASNAAMLILGDGAAKWHIENDTNDFFSLTQSGVAQRFAIDTDGNVGIGVYNASYRLDVQSATATMRVRATDGDIAASTVYQNNLSNNFEIGINGGSHLTNPNDAYIWQYTNNDLRLGTNNTERLLIEADGDALFSGASVAIGTAALQGSLILNDGNGQTATIQVNNTLAANTVLTIPGTLGASDIFCFVNLGNCTGAGDGGVLTVGTFSTTNTAANGATISGTEIIFQAASATAPGMVRHDGSQTFGGDKTFNGSVTVATNLTVDTNTLFVDATNNRVGIGTATPAAPLDVTGTAQNIANGSIARVLGTLNSTSNNQTGLRVAPVIAPSAAVTGSPLFTALTMTADSSSSNLGTAGLAGIYGGTYYSGTGTVANAYGAYLQNQIVAAGTITNSYGLYVDNPVRSAGTITNNYGLYIKGQTQGTNNYAIYSEGSANFFGGSLQFASLNCTTFTNGGALTTDASGNVSCSNDDGGSTVTLQGAYDNSASPATINQIHGKGMVINGAQPAAQTLANGTNATTVLTVTGGQGGNSSLLGATAGNGGGLAFTSGAGGNATGGGASVGGNGGTIAIQAGAGGTGATNGLYGSLNLQTSGGSTTIGNALANYSVTLLGGTGGVSIANGGVANTVQIGNTTGAVLQNINIGNNATASSTTNVIIGSTIGTSTTTLRAGSGGIIGTGTLTVSGLSTFNGGLTIEAGDTFTMNGDAFTDLTGTGLTISGGALQTTLGTSVTLTSEVDGVLPIANGGTNANTAQGAINNLSGLTTNGDLLYHNGTNSVRLARGTNGQCLTSNATTLVWGACGVSGSGTAGQISYWTGATTQGGDASFVWDSTGKELRVYDATATNYARIYYTGGEAVFAASSGTTRIGSGTGDVNITSSTGTININSSTTIELQDSTNVTGNLAATGNLTVDTNTLFVDATNNRVGIGTITPAFNLNVVGSGNTFVSNDAYAGIAVFQGRRANGTVGSPTAVGNNEVITQLSARGHNGTAFTGTQAAVVLQTGQAWTGAANGTAIRFQVTENGTTTLRQEVGINDDGSLVIARSDVVSNGARLRVVAHSSATIGTIIEGAASQTADLLQFRNSAASVLTGFNAAGNMFYRNSGFTSTIENGVLGASRTLTIPGGSVNDTFCLLTAANCGGSGSSGIAGAIQFSNGSGGFNSDATNFFWDNTNKNLGIGVASPTNARLEVSTTGATAQAAIFTSSNITGASNTVMIRGGLSRQSTNSTYQSGLSMENSITPTAGASNISFIDVNGTVNQSGGTGITNGLLIRPTLTSATDFRAINLQNNSGWGIYQAGASAPNYFAGNMGIGTATIDAKIDGVLTDTSTTANTLKGIEMTVTDTGIVTTGTDTTYGGRIAVTRTGATGGTINTFGLDIQATGDAGGTSTVTGLNVNVSGGDINYAALFNGGNVGIGTTTPAGRLHVAGSTFADSRIITQRNSADNLGSSMTLRKSRGTDAVPTDVLNGDTLGLIYGGGYQDGDYRTAGYLGWVAGDVTQANQVGSNFYISVRNAASGLDLVPFSIMESGRVGVGTGAAALDAKLQVNTEGAAVIGQIIQGAASQTADLLQVKNSANLVMSSVSANGAWLIRNAVNSTTAMDIQNAAGNTVFGIDTTNGEAVLGKASTLTGKLKIYTSANANTVTITAGTTTASYNLVLPTSAGSAGQCLMNSGTPGALAWGSCAPASGTKRLRLHAEYPNSVLDNGGTGNNTGTMVSALDLATRMNYFNWTSSEATSQSYDVVVQVPLPSDFGSFSGTNPIRISSFSSSLANTAMTFELRDTGGTVRLNFVNIEPGTASTWTEMDPGDISAGTYTAGGYITLRIRVAAQNAANARIGNIYLDYNPLSN